MNSGSQRGPDRLHHLVVGGETGSALLRDDPVAHADGELAAGAFDHGRIDARLGLDERGHTGRAGQVVSDAAVANLDVAH